MSTRALRVLSFLMVFTVSTPAMAQWRIGGSVGAEHESSWDEFLVLTFEARGAIANGRADIAPRLSYFMREGVSRYQLDVNVLKSLVLASPLKVTPYVGLGGAFESFSPDGGDGETAVGLNYVVGATTRSSSALQGYAQFQYSVLHDVPNVAVVSVGFLYRLGGARSASWTAIFD
jgi:hypothetical protein